ncbi:MAG TPA: BamA/TamA family outer membrane protein [Bryobacteraceae bacterium]|nr:BamA/TamA family outer membrane protein [Bryobacteraceae bacterium]
MCLLSVLQNHAQEPSLPTRAAEITLERQQKQRELTAETNSKWEDRVIYVRESRLLERFTAGVAGVRVKLGGLATNGGFAAGPEYLRTDLRDGLVTLRASAQGSLKKFQKYDVEVGMPRIAGQWLSWNVYAVHHNYPELQYYGSGPNSEKTGRSDFRLEDTAVDTSLAFHPLHRVTVAGQLGYLQNNVGRGASERFISTDEQFTEATTPGIVHQADFVRYGAFVQYDHRDRAGGARSGGLYYAQWARYVDQIRGAFSHHRVDIEAQQFIPLINARRVIALRGRTSLTSADSGHRVPFYLKPVMGGSESVRGYRPYRFYGDQALLMTAEYRYEVFSGLDMAVFADAGKVADHARDLDLRNLESSVGFGLRFNVRNNVFLRVDTAFSHEGFQVWFKFNNVFASGPVKTSSSQGEF